MGIFHVVKVGSSVALVGFEVRTQRIEFVWSERSGAAAGANVKFESNSVQIDADQARGDGSRGGDGRDGIPYDAKSIQAV